MTDINTLDIPEAIDALDRALMASSIPTEELVEVRVILRSLKAGALNRALNRALMAEVEALRRQR